MLFIFEQIFFYFYPPKAFTIPIKFIAIIAIEPNSIDIPNPVTTPLQKSLSPNRYAIDAFTILFDIAAMRIVDAAIIMAMLPSQALDAIS